MPLWFPSHKALAFGDAVVGVEDGLRIWDTLDGKSSDWYRERFLPTSSRCSSSTRSTCS